MYRSVAETHLSEMWVGGFAWGWEFQETNHRLELEKRFWRRKVRFKLFIVLLLSDSVLIY